VRIDGTMAELLAQGDPKLYRKHVITTRKGKKVMFAETKKTMYGTLNVSLLFWLKLSGSLEKLGFKMNPYDWYCMNKMVDGNQLTILWHVNNLQISHMDSSVVSGLLK